MSININQIESGTDIEEIARFQGKSLENDSHFFSHIFTNKELDYCFSKSHPAQHLCARFCAKEAITKALCGFKVKDVLLNDIEILNEENGRPYINLVKHPEYIIKISLSHTKIFATATAIIYKIKEN